MKKTKTSKKIAQKLIDHDPVSYGELQYLLYLSLCEIEATTSYVDADKSESFCVTEVLDSLEELLDDGYTPVCSG